MKRKLILPLMAFVFALAGAFASTLSPQMAWFKPITGPAESGAIDFPVVVTEDDPCTLVGSTQCQINGRNAYDTEAHANAQGPEGLLKYD